MIKPLILTKSFNESYYRIRLSYNDSAKWVEHYMHRDHTTIKDLKKYHKLLVKRYNKEL